MRNIPAREDLDQISAFDNPEHPQRKAIESVPPGHVLVLDCRGEKRVASGGQILTTRLKVRGAAGLVSDGPVRDSGAIAQMDFPVYCAGGSAPLNLLHHHAIDLNVPIGCGGVAVYPGRRHRRRRRRRGRDPAAPGGRGRRATARSRRRWKSSSSSASRAAPSSPGTYPPNAETRAAYAEWRKKHDD